MRTHPRTLTIPACILTLAASAVTLSGQYSLTVNKDRLINSANEPQNWLLMNGDYGSQRYSRLTQITRDNVKDLRMVWALALGGMQDVGQNGPENEINPLIDNGFMYTSDGWGTIYKIDARQPNRGSSCGWPTPASRTRATPRARAASRSGKTRCSPTCRTAA